MACFYTEDDSFVSNLVIDSNKLTIFHCYLYNINRYLI